MTRVGWIILGLILLALAAFLATTRFGGPLTPRRQAVPPALGLPIDPSVPGSLRVPVEGVERSALEDNWGDPREGGTRVHHGMDVMAPGGTPVVAVTSGTIEKLFQSERGGTTLYLRSANRHWVFYYAHLAGYAPGLVEGQRVRSGQRLGYVGDSGDAGAGNYHLHLGVQRMHPGDRWWQGEDVNPYPLLAASAPSR